MKHQHRRFITVAAIVVLALLIGVVVGCDRGKQTASNTKLTKIRFGISPFQDTIVPIIGREKGWYREEGLDVEFYLLGWTEVMEALSAGRVDVAINNESSVIATHEKNPQIIYWYGINPFDNGFALMIRPDGKLKTILQIEASGVNHAEAVRQTAAQLRGKKVITTGKTDMEQGVIAAARKAGMMPRDVTIIDMNPEEGLAAFLRGEGDVYIGGIPQRVRAGKEGMLEMLTGADLGPPPVNGFVTTKAYDEVHRAELLKLLKVWFKTVNYVNANMDEAGTLIATELNKSSSGKFTIEDFKKFWNNYEHYPANPKEVEALILNSSGRNYWKARWDDCNSYFFEITHTIKAPVDPKDAFFMSQVHASYLEKYGNRY